MKAVIPCAKKKDDMFPFSETMPTALMPLMGEPIVERLVDSLEETGVDEVYLIANHRIEMIDEYFSDRDTVEVIEQEELDGTGSAVELADIQEEFFVVNGDVSVTRNDLENLREAHDSNVSDVTMLATEDSRPEKYGVLSITNDRVEGIVEKPEEPENNLVNTGIYIFGPRIFEVLDEMDGEKELTEAVSRIVDRDGARFELVEDYWMDIGTPQKLRKADRTLRSFALDGQEIADSAEVADSAVIEGDVRIEEDAVIKPGTVLEDKTFVGEESLVGPNTVVRDSSVGRKSLLRNASIDESLLFNENILDPQTSIERSVMAEETDVKSGTVIRESFIGARSFIDMNNSIRGLKFVPDARTDLSEISK